MKDIVIKVENLSKAYRIGAIGSGTISQDLNRWFARVSGKEDPFLKIGERNNRSKKGNSEVIWSLKDINFEIERGEAVGIIGKNGAGKSTLLKILSKITAPTTGRILGKGRVASLLEVGTGFHPELSGRENIFLNGAILGMRKREIQCKIDEIINFAGIERYIDTPVKRYSSGMYVRLAFAVAAHLESEVLIIDEVLAVGDAEFQKKCLGKMGEVSKGEGRTVLFVSHNMSAIRELCTRGILMSEGHTKSYDSANVMINQYLSETQIIRQKKKFNEYLEWVQIEQVSDVIKINLCYHVNIALDIPHFGFVIYNSENIPVFASNPTLEGIKPQGNQYFRGEINIEISEPKLCDGIYNLSIWFGSSNYNFLEDKDCLTFEVLGMSDKIHYNPNIIGNVIPKTTWQFKSYD